jgi:hypothetical protein
VEGFERQGVNNGQFEGELMPQLIQQITSK